MSSRFQFGMFEFDGETGECGEAMCGSPANLFHIGSRVFHPADAEAVRVRFAPGDLARSVTIEDGAFVVTARRV